MKLLLHLRCVAKQALPKNRSTRCKSLLQTAVSSCPFNLSLSLKKHRWPSLAVPHIPLAVQHCPHEMPPHQQHVVSTISNITACTRGFTDTFAQVAYPKRRQFFCHNHLGTAIHLDAVITANGIEKDSNGSELVWHSPSLHRSSKPFHDTTWNPRSNQPENK